MPLLSANTHKKQDFRDNKNVVVKEFFLSLILLSQ